jgi:hypothetical protein
MTTEFLPNLLRIAILQKNRIIKTIKFNESIEIFVPAIELFQFIEIQTGSVISLFCFLTALVFALLHSTSSLAVFLSIWLILFAICCFSLLQETIVIILDQNFIHIKRRCFNNKNLEYAIVKGYKKNVNNILISNCGRIHQVSVSINRRNYFIGQNLNKTEAAWLTQELQNWLRETREKSKNLPN